MEPALFLPLTLRAKLELASQELAYTDDVRLVLLLVRQTVPGSLPVASVVVVRGDRLKEGTLGSYITENLYTLS